MWQAIGLVTSGLTLLAFAISATVTVIRARLRARQQQLEAAPESARADLVLALNDVFLVPSLPVDPRTLTKEQAYKLLLEQIRDRSRRFYVTSVLAGFIAIVLAVVAIYALSREHDSDKSQSGSAGAAKPISIPPEGISPAPGVRSLAVQAPNGGEKWQGRSHQDIRWITDGPVGGTATIFLLTGNGASLVVKANVPTREGRYNWDVGLLADGTMAPPSDAYRITVSSENFPNEAFDTSDEVFAIVP